MPYILEIQQFHPRPDSDWNGKSIHLGYMNKIFKTKKEASNYYNKFNPHMRPLNAHNNWCSDWDPHTRLMYIVRKRYYENLKIPPFI